MPCPLSTTDSAKFLRQRHAAGGIALGHVREDVADEVHPAALMRAALHGAGDGGDQAAGICGAGAGEIERGRLLEAIAAMPFLKDEPRGW